MDLNLREPVTYIGERPSEFCVVTPFFNLARYAEEAARRMNVRTCIAVSEFDNDVEVALEMIRTEKVRLLATRGHAVQILRNKTDVPVLSIGYSSENFFETLLPYQNSGTVVGHICFPGQGLNFMKVARLLGLEGHRLEVEDRNNIDAALQTAREKQVALLVGGYGLISKARAQGFHAIPLLSENRDSVYQVFTEAKHAITIDDVNTHKHVFINTVLNINPNSIVVVDNRYRIKYANDSAFKAFESINPDIIGASLETLFPDADLSAVFADAADKQESTILTDASRRDFLCSIVAISLRHSFKGFVISLSNVVEIQKNERKVRQNRYGRDPRPLFCFEDIIGKSPDIQRTRQLALRFADSDSPVLIVGETGTGKEMFAQAIHAQSKRRGTSFISVNCAALPETLMESELFGYEEGAFTGARRGGKIGLFELAHGGTLFLDEIGEMPEQLQSRLLRVLQDNMVIRLGGTRVVPVDVRIICATNRNIVRMVDQGTFRADLFYRINTLILKIPSLEERKEDIETIVQAHIQEKAAQHGTVIRITPEALAKLRGNTWPGNVRELLHIIDRAIVLRKKDTITSEDVLLDAAILSPESNIATMPESFAHGAEYSAIREALAVNQYNKGKTAAALGMSRATLWRKMKQYAL